MRQPEKVQDLLLECISVPTDYLLAEHSEYDAVGGCWISVVQGGEENLVELDRAGVKALRKFLKEILNNG